MSVSGSESRPAVEVRDLADEIVALFDALIRGYLERLPLSAREFARAFPVNALTIVKAWLGVALLALVPISGRRRYLFEGFRNTQLIDCLDPREVVVFGGRRDLIRALRRGHGFFWTGGLVAAICLARTKQRPRALRLLVALTGSKLRNNRWFTILYEDTLPTGIFFAKVTNSYGHTSVCVQHGVGNQGLNFADGKLCKYNLLYAHGQEKLIHAPGTTFFELGPPFDVDTPTDLVREVVLVGTGDNDLEPEVYLRSLRTFHEIQERLKDRSWRVVYRPHPCEIPAQYTPYFDELDMAPKEALLAGKRRIFAGYISTLLFEAKTAGHGVIALRDPARQPLTYQPHAEIADEALAQIVPEAERVLAILEKEGPAKLVPVRERFVSILGRISQLEQKSSPYAAVQMGFAQ